MRTRASPSLRKTHSRAGSPRIVAATSGEMIHTGDQPSVTARDTALEDQYPLFWATCPPHPGCVRVSIARTPFREGGCDLTTHSRAQRWYWWWNTGWQGGLNRGCHDTIDLVVFSPLVVRRWCRLFRSVAPSVTPRRVSMARTSFDFHRRIRLRLGSREVR